MRVKPIRLLLILILAILPGACAHDTDWLYRAEYEILATDTGDDWILVDGNHATEFRIESEIEIYATDKDGADVTYGPYVIEAITATMGGTRITIEENVPDEDLVGAILMQLSGEDNEPDPEQIQIYFETTGNLSPEVWYYLVFNFSQATGALNPTTAASPEPLISGEDRGKNWEMYVLVHVEDNGNVELTAQRTTRLPTILPTALGPVDTTTGFFNDDDEIDIAVACYLDNTVDLIPAHNITDYYDDEDIEYWEDDEILTLGNGPGPLRIHGGDQNGDDIDDLVILYTGDDTDGGFLRILTGVDANDDNLHDGTFSSTTFSDLDLGVTPVDWLIYDDQEDETLDFNGDGYPDLAVLGTTGGAGQLLILNGQEGGGFTLGATYATGAGPVSLAGGVLLDSSFDLAVGSNSGTGGTGEIQVFTADGNGGFAANTVLPVEGTLANVAVAKMMGSVRDIVATYNTADQAGVAIYLNEADEFFTESPEIISYTGSAYCLLPLDTSDDNYTDIVVTDGIPGEQNHTMYIIQRNGDKPTLFQFEDELINYLIGTDPGRIHLTDLDGDGNRDDFVIPNNFNGSGGNGVTLVYGQGQSNFTDANRYWVDYQPTPLNNLKSQEWYAGHSVGPNSFLLAIDPLNFYNLTQLEVEHFVVDIMTADAAPDFLRNVVDGVEQRGEILESLSAPMGVSVEVDYLEDENTHNKALDVPADPAADIDFWKIEVI